MAHDVRPEDNRAAIADVRQRLAAAVSNLHEELEHLRGVLAVIEGVTCKEDK